MKILCRLSMAALTPLVMLMVVSTVQAQDVVKVAPESHKVILENDQVRVLRVRLKPREKVAMHSHPDSIAYFLTDGKLKVTFPDGKTAVREPKADTSSWSGGTTHEVENIGSSVFEEVQIELKPAAKKAN